MLPLPVDAWNNILLFEFLKEHKKVKEQQGTIVDPGYSCTAASPAWEMRKSKVPRAAVCEDYVLLLDKTVEIPLSTPGNGNAELSNLPCLSAINPTQSGEERQPAADPRGDYRSTVALSDKPRLQRVAHKPFPSTQRQHRHR